MAKNYSDFTFKQLKISELLPEVYTSDYSNNLYQHFDKMLSKTDSARVYGFIERVDFDRPYASVIREAIPHRQAYQLVPIARTEVGTKTKLLTFTNWMQRLSLMGVDHNSFDEWGKNNRYNWAPPINMDMFANYQNYAWITQGTDKSEYVVIESPCFRSKNRAKTYSDRFRSKSKDEAINFDSTESDCVLRALNTLEYYSESKNTEKLPEYSFKGFAVDLVANTISISGDFTRSMSKDMLIYVSTASYTNLEKHFFTIETLEYISDSNVTIIRPYELLVKPSETEPEDKKALWYRNNDGVMQYYTFYESLNEWVHTIPTIELVIDMHPVVELYRDYAATVCGEELGWNEDVWGLGRKRAIVWSRGHFRKITAETEEEWVRKGGKKSVVAAWYNPTTDIAYRWSIKDKKWYPVYRNISAVIKFLIGAEALDDIGSRHKHSSDFSSSNKWLPFASNEVNSRALRAQFPIIEYDSRVELSGWYKLSYEWVYRATTNDRFKDVDVSPVYLELVPITQYFVTYERGKWTVNIYGGNNIKNNTDFTESFKPGYEFAIEEENGKTNIYTVEESYLSYDQEADAGVLKDAVKEFFPRHTAVTKVVLKENEFLSPYVSTGSHFIRPKKTSVGDDWSGYTHHWCLSDVITSKASSQSRPYDYNEILYTGATKDHELLANKLPTTRRASLGTYFVEYFLTENAPVSLFEFPDRFVPGNRNSYEWSIADGSNVRVFVNGIRVYEGFEFVQETFTIPDSYKVGSRSIDITVVAATGIRFNTPLTQRQTLRLEFGGASAHDTVTTNIPIRTELVDGLFERKIRSGDQPALTSISSYVKQEQQRANSDGYPLFNIYDVSTNEIVKSSPIVWFKESPNANINEYLHKRIQKDSSGMPILVTDLVGEDRQLFAYRLVDDNMRVWDNGSTVRVWIDSEWLESYYDVRTRVRYNIKFVEKYEHIEQHMQGVFFVKNDSSLYLKDVAGVIRNIGENIQIITGNVDPTLRTIWRTSAQSEYQPDWVDGDRKRITKLDAAGYWELPEPWIHNPEHDNTKEIDFNKLSLHFRSILDAQNVHYTELPFMNQDQVNPGIGGHIHEYGYGYDKLISAVNAEDSSPIKVLEFVYQAYERKLTQAREYFIKLFSKKLMSSASFDELKESLTADIIRVLETNDMDQRVFFESNTFVDGKGLKNCVPTLPVLGLAPKTKPSCVLSDNNYILTHHDGHKSVISLNGRDYDLLKHSIASYSKSLKVRRLPLTASEFVDYKVDVQATTYVLNGVDNNVYSMAVRSLSAAQPSGTSDVNGDFITGDLHYNTTTKEFSVFDDVSGTWLLTTDLGNRWELVNFLELLASTLLEIEDRLYEVCPDKYTDLTQKYTNHKYFNQLMNLRFDQYVRDRNLINPFTNKEYEEENPYTWNYKFSTIQNYPNHRRVANKSSWLSVMEHLFNTSFITTEPWKLQGFDVMPEWWMDEYANKHPNRPWSTKMWQNIKNGVLPEGRFDVTSYKLEYDGVYYKGEREDLPLASVRRYFNIISPSAALEQVGLVTVVPKYEFVPVNIDDTNSMFPLDHQLPMFLYEDAKPSNTNTLITDYDNVTTPNGSYEPYDGNALYWEWKHSSQYEIDKLIVAFQIDPIRICERIFNIDSVVVDGLHIDRTTKRIESHKDALFHGDLYKNKVYVAKGLNQLYTMYYNYNSLDFLKSLKTLWAGWNMSIGYQVGNIIDTDTIDVHHKIYDIIPDDYQVILSENGYIDDYTVSGYRVRVLHVPANVLHYNNQGEWKFQIEPIGVNNSSFSYYDVRRHPVLVDNDRLVVGEFDYEVVHKNAISIEGNVKHYVERFGLRRQDKSMIRIVSVSYDSINNKTVVETKQQFGKPGTVELRDFDHGWQTGEVVIFETTRALPTGLLTDTPYYVIRDDERHIRLALSEVDAKTNISVELPDSGIGDLSIASVVNTYLVYGGQSSTTNNWYHYAIDTSAVREHNAYTEVQGVQNLLNILDGIAAFNKDKGVIYGNPEFEDIDPETGRLIDWQLESERFLDWVYRYQYNKLKVRDYFEANVDSVTKTLRFTSYVPAWLDGLMVRVETNSTGRLPEGLSSNTPYYFYRGKSTNEFTLSNSADPLDVSGVITLKDIGEGEVRVMSFDRARNYPVFEINPIRNNIEVSTPYGIVDDITKVPFLDSRVIQTITDQYGRTIDPANLIVLRDDLRTRIRLVDERPRSENTLFFDDQDNMHIGSARMFVKAYEHIIMFNNKTVDGVDVYNHLSGTTSSKIWLEFTRAANFTFRPSMGGFYLNNGNFKRNIEHSASYLKYLYDDESHQTKSIESKFAKRLLGYRGNLAFMEKLGISDSTQYKFFKGFSQTKGSINSFAAYTNNRHFIDSSADEYWAVRVGSFGSINTPFYPELKLYTEDSKHPDINIQLITSEDVDHLEKVDVLSPTTQLVTPNDAHRWTNPYDNFARLKDGTIFESATKIVKILTLDLEEITKPSTDQYGFSNTIDPIDWMMKRPPHLWYGYLRNQLIRLNLFDNVVSGKPICLFEDIHYVAYFDTRINKVYAFLLDHKNEEAILNIDSTIHIRGDSLMLCFNKPFESAEAYIRSNGNAQEVTKEYIFTKLNSRTLEMSINNLKLRTCVIEFVNIVPNNNTNNPAALVDSKTGTVVSRIPVWDPARGMHNTHLIQNVSLFNNTDPAVYTVTPVRSIPAVNIRSDQVSDYIGSNEVLFESTDLSTNAHWKADKVGQVWLDTSTVHYVHYFDEAIHPNYNERMKRWGRLAPWSNPKVYRWTESSNIPTANVNDAKARISHMYKTRLQFTAFSDLANNRVMLSAPSLDFMKNRIYNVFMKEAFENLTNKKFVVFYDKDDLTFAEFKVGDVVTLSYDYDVNGNSWFRVINSIGEEVQLTTLNENGKLYFAEHLEERPWIKNTTHVHHVSAYMFDGMIGNSINAQYESSRTLKWKNVSSGKISIEKAYHHLKTLYGGTYVDVYINDMLVEQNAVLKIEVDEEEVSNPYVSMDRFKYRVDLQYKVELFTSDIVTIVEHPHEATINELLFDETTDDGTAVIQYKDVVEYSTDITFVNEYKLDNATQKYYFWTEDTSTPLAGGGTISSVKNSLTNISTPYMVIQMPFAHNKAAQKYGWGISKYGRVYDFLNLQEYSLLSEYYYSSVTVRNVTGNINSDERYTIRFTNDKSLRDHLPANDLTYKNYHEAWTLIRPNQLSLIPRFLLDKLKESILGYKLSDAQQPVPSLERVLYDEANGTATRIGLGEGQTFTTSENARKIILDYLLDNDNDFTPFDPVEFVSKYDIEDRTEFVKMVDDIINTFDSKHVNSMWFEVLYDALSLQPQYKDVFKTSWISLHGVRIVDANGYFED